MSAIKFTGTALTIARDEVVSDPKTGRSREVEWVGSKTAIYGLSNTMGGVKWRVGQRDALWTLTANFERGEITPPPEESATAEQPVDRWTVTTDVLDRTVYLHPKAQADIAADEAGAYAYKAKMEKMLVSGVDNGWLDTFPGAGVNARAVFYELQRGADNYEDENMVLRWQRQMPSSWTTKLTLQATRKIYSTAQLPIPTALLFSLPDFPTTPLKQAQWGWRLRGQESEYEGDRVVQTHVWALAAWSTFLYDVATTNYA
jgi:hypothetical protein